MGRSQTTFKKRELQKQKIRKRQDKMEKMQERKASAGEKDWQDMIAYVDENGNLTSTPPDPKKQKEFKKEDIQIGVPRLEERDMESEVRSGIITFFSVAKGFGFVKDESTGESAFVHINQLPDSNLRENDRIMYETERNFKGLSAVNIRKAV